jgi:hypothetical protein
LIGLGMFDSGANWGTGRLERVTYHGHRFSEIRDFDFNVAAGHSGFETERGAPADASTEFATFSQC